MNTRITIIYDNLAQKGYNSGWGFAAVIEKDDKKILFDTCWDGPALLKNMKKAGFDPKEIDFVVISHEHWDHLGGLSSFLNNAKRPIVIVPSSFSSSLKTEITRLGEIREVTKTQPYELFPGVETTTSLTTSRMGLTEISLIIDTKKGLLVICGCSHPGLDTIIDYCQKKGTVYSVIGGFHGFKKLKKLEKINTIIPCHCTRLKDEILQKFPDSSKKCQAGAQYTFE